MQETKEFKIEPVEGGYVIKQLILFPKIEYVHKRTLKGRELKKSIPIASATHGWVTCAFPVLPNVKFEWSMNIDYDAPRFEEKRIFETMEEAQGVIDGLIKSKTTPPNRTPDK